MPMLNQEGRRPSLTAQPIPEQPVDSPPSNESSETSERVTAVAYAEIAISCPEPHPLVDQQPRLSSRRPVFQHSLQTAGLHVAVGDGSMAGQEAPSVPLQPLQPLDIPSPTGSRQQLMISQLRAGASTVGENTEITSHALGTPTGKALESPVDRRRRWDSSNHGLGSWIDGSSHGLRDIGGHNWDSSSHGLKRHVAGIRSLRADPTSDMNEFLRAGGLPSNLTLTTEEKHKRYPHSDPALQRLTNQLIRSAIVSPGTPPEPKGRFSAIIKWLMTINGTMSWLDDTDSALMQHPFIKFVVLNLRGVGQVYFANNPVSGFLILVALYIQSARVATHGLIGLISGNLFSIALGLNQGHMFAGLHGYDAVLAGLAIGTFHQGWDAYLIALTILASGLTSIFFAALSKILAPYKVVAYTLPFNFTLFMFLLASASMLRIATDLPGNPSLPLSANHVKESPGLPLLDDCIKGIFRSIGQVFLADNLASGVIILVAVGICSRITAFAALWGSFLGFAVALSTGCSAGALSVGLRGYNSSLTCAAVFGMFYAPSFYSFLLGSLAACFTAFADDAFATLLQPIGLPNATLPFCVLTLLFMIIQDEQSRVPAVPAATLTVPEDHRRRVTHLTAVLRMLLAMRNRGQALAEAVKMCAEGHINRYHPWMLQDLFEALADHKAQVDVKQLALLIATALGSPDRLIFTRIFRAKKTATFEEFEGLMNMAAMFWSCKVQLEDLYNFCDYRLTGSVSAFEFLHMQRAIGAAVFSLDDFEQLAIEASSGQGADELNLKDILILLASRLGGCTSQEFNFTELSTRSVKSHDSEHRVRGEHMA